MGFNYESRTRVQSTACPGVTIVLNKITEGRRMELRKALFASSRRVRKLLADMEPIRDRIRTLVADKQAELITHEDLTQISSIREEMDEINDLDVYPQWIKMGVYSVEGLEIDGVPAKAEDIPNGPPELYQEVLTEIQKVMGLSEEEIKNLRSLFISNKSADGATNATTVESAESTDSIAPATAPSSTPTP
jgi:hypothetical protein